MSGLSQQSNLADESPTDPSMRIKRGMQSPPSFYLYRYARETRKNRDVIVRLWL
jgi:hypothetical protein